VPSPNRSVSPALWIIIGAACVFFGVLGYVIGTSGRAPAATVAAPPAAAAPAPSGGSTAPVDEAQLQTYRDLLRLDPRNLEAATQAANLLYDAGRYAEAIPLYRQAFALDPANINISTDLGTALWYTGQADEALAQYAKSLTLNPTHPHTLFNVGVVKMEGKNDARGAIEAWEKLLKTNPSYSEAEKVRARLAKALQQPGS